MGKKPSAHDKKEPARALKIARAAARLFSRKGYLDTTMDEIATAAKVSKGGMYYYFPGKTDVLFFILSNYMDLVLAGLTSDLSEIHGGEEKLKFLIVRHIRLYATHVHEAKVLLHDAHCLSPKQFKMIADKERTYYRVVKQVLKESFGTRMKEAQLTSTTFILFGMCNWIYAWYNPKGSIAPRELSALIYRIFIGGTQTF
jgi:TetR/AcrR family transcriptional regulator